MELSANSYVLDEGIPLVLKFAETTLYDVADADDADQTFLTVYDRYVTYPRVRHEFHEVRCRGFQR